MVDSERKLEDFRDRVVEEREKKRTNRQRQEDKQYGHLQDKKKAKKTRCLLPGMGV